jgi:hypothetical protein
MFILENPQNSSELTRKEENREQRLIFKQAFVLNCQAFPTNKRKIPDLNKPTKNWESHKACS